MVRPSKLDMPPKRAKKLSYPNWAKIKIPNAVLCLSGNSNLSVIKFMWRGREA